MWKAKDGQKDGLPILAPKMALQFLGPARPVVCGGVERMFSKAGKLHGEDKQRQEDRTLERCLSCSARVRALSSLLGVGGRDGVSVFGDGFVARYLLVCSDSSSIQSGQN